ncbi:hypothetical protein Tco_0991987 [Tanacetum coccineum]|uniref:Xylulose kinase-1 n=1 Tax=Tanacetum coccineum TaxID=301880 RepID=A0ABQ5F1J7_9ASTR
MSDLKFADTHNLVAFLAKPTESEGFEQIMDFLNANPINYALTINPTIYTSCIEQFWATTKAKTVNEEVQLQALVDGKKVIITETSVRRDLQLEDAYGIDCLPNAAIFEQLTLMGYEKLSQKLTFYKAFFSPQWKFLIHTILQCLSAKTTTWNKFSSIMASAIIFLATNKMFNFSKCIFESMLKNLNNENKFLMYPRFIQVFVNQQLGDMSNHKRIFVTPSHTKKIFGNMKREGKGFSGRVTPLFPTMVKKQKPRKPKRKDTEIPQSSGPTEPIADEAANEEDVPTHSNDLLLSGEDRLKLKELMALCTNLQNRVLDLEHTKTTQALEIESLKRRVKKLKKKQRSRTHKLKRLYKVGLSVKVVSSKDEGLGEEDASKTGGEEIMILDAGWRNYLKILMQLAELKNTKPKAVTTAATTTTTAVTRPKAKGLVIQEQEQASTPITSSKDKEVIRLQAQFDEEDRIAREKEKANAALIAQWNDIQDKVETDYELAQRLQVEEQEELTIEEKSKLFQQLLEKRRKFFAANKAKEKRNKPPTKS